MTETNPNTTYNSLNNQEEQFQIQFIDIWHMIWDYKWWYVLSIFVALSIAFFYLYRSPEVYERTEKFILDEGAQEAAMRDISSFAGSVGSRIRYATNVDNEVEAISSPDIMEIVVKRLELETSYYEHQLFRQVELGPKTPIKLILAGDNPSRSIKFDVTKRGASSFELHDFVIGGEELKDAKAVKGEIGDTITTPVGLVSIVFPDSLSASRASSLNWSNDMTVAWSNAKSKAKAFARNTTVSLSGKQTSVVVITVKDLFPSRAENILKTLVNVYDEEWIHNKNRSARVTTGFINDRLVVIEEDLDKLESDLKNYKESNKVNDISAVGSAYLSQANKYAEKEFELSNQIAIAEYIKEYITKPENSEQLIPSNSGLISSGVESQIAEFNKNMLERDRLAANSSEYSPVIAEMNTALASMRGAIERSIDNLIATLKLQQSDIIRQEDKILAKIARTTGQEFALLSIERQQKVKESLYVYLLQKREENEIAGLVNVGNTRMIMAPNGSSAPVEPRRSVVLLLALMLGAGLPFGIIFLKRMLDFTVHSKDDVVKTLSMPFLADIPETLAKKDRKKYRLFQKLALNDDQRRIVVKSGSRNTINEAFRVLRTNVDMMLRKEEGTRTVMVTSYYAGSGKTFISLNLAASMALKGTKTIVVDLDLRKASLSTALGGNGTGVSSFLSGKESLLTDCISNISDNLDVLKCGTLPPNPTELLLSDEFRDMMETLKRDYDFVVLDCPPIEIVADSSIITDYVDMTIFVVRAGLMDRRNLPAIEEIYQSDKYTRMAAILNGVVTTSKGYGHYGYGHYGYGSYGYGSYGYGSYGYGGYAKEDED